MTGLKSPDLSDTAWADMFFVDDRFKRYILSVFLWNELWENRNWFH